MESSLVIELKIALVDIGYFAGLTPVGNSQFNLGKSWDEFKSKMKQGTWWTPITLHKEDTAHSSWMKELHKTISEAEGLTRWQKIKERKDGIIKGWERKGAI